MEGLGHGGQCRQSVSFGNEPGSGIKVTSFFDRLHHAHFRYLHGCLISFSFLLKCYYLMVTLYKMAM